jgi:cytochrome c-type biogenesis protein CcmH/NrfG
MGHDGNLADAMPTPAALELEIQRIIQALQEHLQTNPSHDY